MNVEDSAQKSALEDMHVAYDHGEVQSEVL